MARPKIARALRLALWAVIAQNLAMIGARVALDPQLLGMPGGLHIVLGPAVLLVEVAAFVGWATSRGRPVDLAVLREGTTFGLIAGALEIAHITVENYGNLSPRAESASTGAFMLGLLALWAFAGYRVAGGTKATGPGLFAGSWCAMVGMLVTVIYGYSQLFWDLPRLERRNVGSPDFLRSGWTDLHAFTIADIFEAGFKVLLVGPIAGALFGGVGAVVARALAAVRHRRPG
jgi:hypothetical protein